MANNINTLVSSYNGIKSGSYVGGQTEEKKSLSQLNKAASIASGANRDANPKKISGSTLNNTASYLSGAKKTVYASDKEEDDTSLVSPNEDIYNRFMETVGPYVNMSESEKQYYYNMSGMIMKNGQSADEWAEDFLSKNALANVLGVSRSTVEQYLPQIMEDYLGVENEKYLTFTTGATLINSIKQGVRQQEQADLQGDLINLYKSGYDDSSPEVQTLARAILQKDREMSYYQDSTPRLWTTEWAKSALQQLPYMAVGTLAGIAGNIIGGVAGSIIPGVGTTLGAQIGGGTARFLTYQKQFEASAFWNMKQAGVSTETALKYADIDGFVNGLNEAFLDVGYSQIMGATGKVLGVDDLGGKLIPSVTGKLTKNGSFGSFMGKFLLWMGLDASGEFVQESTQSLTSAALQAMAEYEDGIRMSYTDKEKVSDAFSQAWDEGVQGFLTGLFFGGQTSAVGILADVKTSANLKNTAIKTLSKESYVNNKENRQAVQNLRLGGAELSEEQIDKLLSGLYDSSQSARNELKNNVRKDIFEQLKNIDGTLEESSILNRVSISDKDIRNESGEIISGKNTEVKTRDDGSLYFVIDKDVTATPEEGKNTTSYTMRIANPSVVGTSSLGEVYVDAKVAGYENEAIDSVKSSPKALAMEQAGRINFTLNEDNKSLTIESVSVQDDSKSLKTKAVQELISMYPEYTVEWENRTESDNAVYSDIESANPRNTPKETFGLNYNKAFSSDDTDTAYVKRWLGTNFSEDSSENNFMAAMLKAAAKARGMDGQSFIEKYFTEIEESQEDDANTKGYMSTKRDEVTKQVKATIYAGKNADATTFLHELHHAIMLMGDNMKEFTQIYNKVKGTKQFRAFLEENIDLLKERIARKDSDGKFITDEKGRCLIDETKLNSLYKNSEKWTEDDFEFEARLYEAYIRNGQTFNPSLTGFFRRMAETFRQIYRALRNGFFKAKLNDEVIAYFDKLYGYDASTGAESVLSGSGDMQFLDDAILKQDAVKSSIGDYYVSKVKEEDIDNLIEDIVLQANSVDYSKEFNEENWQKEFDRRTFYTPVGNITLGQHQYQKLINKKRTKDWMLIRPTLESPSLILSEINEEGDETGSYNLIKVFNTDDGTKWFYSVVVMVNDEGLFSVSNRRTDERQVKNKLRKTLRVYSTTEISAERGNVQNSQTTSVLNNNIDDNGESVKSLKQDTISSLSAEEQYEAVKNQYYGTNKYMIAPNGRASNLTERQWIQVRTPNFKEWFGDWENDPQNASKVLDENGEPLVVYHGTPNAGFDTFRFDHDNQTGYNSKTGVGHDYGEAYYFTTDYEKAVGYAYRLGNDPEFIELENARKANIKEAVQAFSDGDIEKYQEARQKNRDYGVQLDAIYEREGKLLPGSEVKETFLSMQSPLIVDAQGEYYFRVYDDYFAEARTNGNDGIIVENVIDNPRGEFRPMNVYIIFSPSQIKSATDNSGDFSLKSDSILKQDGEDKQHELKYKTVDEAEKALSEEIEKSGAPVVEEGKPRMDVSTVQELYALAEEARPEFTSIINSLQKELGIEKERVFSRDGLKSFDRVIEKTVNDYRCDIGRIVDVNGSTFMLDNVANAESVYHRALEILGKEKVANNKDGKTDSGYRDFKINIRTSNGFIGELIILDEATLWEKDKGLGHTIYDITRTLDPYVDKDEISRQKYRALFGGKVWDSIKKLNDDLKAWSIKRYENAVALMNGQYAVEGFNANLYAVSSDIQGLLALLRENLALSYSDGESTITLPSAVRLSMDNSRDSSSLLYASSQISQYLNAIEKSSSNSNVTQNGTAVKSVEEDVENETILKQIAEERSAILQVPTESDFLFQYAYHGAGADFNKFSLDFIGSGEGSQVFGYGLYFTESDVIARKYAAIGYNSSRSYKESQIKSYKEQYEKAKAELEKAGKQRAKDEKRQDELKAEARKEIEDEYKKDANSSFLSIKLGAEKWRTKRLAELESSGTIYTIRDWEFNILKRQYANAKNEYLKAIALPVKDKHLYKVIIPDNGYLSWYDEVPESLIKKIAEYRASEGYLFWTLEEEIERLSTAKTGGDLYALLAGTEPGDHGTRFIDDYSASMILSRVGVVGIKYPAGSILGLPDDVSPDTYNYVIFDPKDIEIADHQILKQNAIVDLDEDDASLSALRNDLESVSDSSVTLKQIGDDEWTQTAKRIALEAGSLEDFFKLYRDRIDSGDIELSDSNTTLLLTDIYEESRSNEYTDYDEYYDEDYEEFQEEENETETDVSDDWVVEEVEDNPSSISTSSMPDEVPDWFDIDEEKTEQNDSDDWVVEDITDENTVAAAPTSPDDIPDWFDLGVPIEDSAQPTASETAKTTEDTIQAIEEALTEVQKVVNDSDLPKGLSLEKSRSLDTSVQARAVEFASILKGSKEETIKFLEALRDTNDEFFYESSYAEEAGQLGAREAVDEESYMQKETRRTAYNDFSNVSKFIQNLIFNSRGAQYAQRLNNLSDRAWKIVAGQVSANPELYMDLYSRASNNTEWAGDNSIESKVLSELGLTKEEWNNASYYKRRMYVQDVADKELKAKIMSGKFVDSEIKDWIKRSEEKAEASLAEAKAIEESQKYVIDENNKTILKLNVEAQEAQKQINNLRDEQLELQDRIDRAVTKMERKLKKNGTPTETETAEHGELVRRMNELKRRQAQYEKALESYQNRFSKRTHDVKDSAATASDVERIRTLVNTAREKVVELEKKNILTPEEAIKRLENLHTVWKDAKTKEAIDEISEHYQQRLKDATQAKHEALSKQHRELSEHYQQRLKDATQAKHEALKKARQAYMTAMREKEALRRIRAEKERLARQIMKAPSSSVALEEAKQIRAIQALLDPKYRRNTMKSIDGVTYSVEELKNIIHTNPDDPVLQTLTERQLERLTKTSLNEMTLAEVEGIYQTVLKLREEGLNKRRAEIVQRKAENQIIREALMNELRANPKYEEYGFEGTEDRKKREKTKRNKIRDTWYNTLNMARKAQTLDNGEKGTFYNLLIRKKRLLENEEMRAVMERSKKIDDVIKDSKFNKDSLYKTWTVKLEDGRDVAFTTSELAYVYLSQNNEDNRDALAYGTFINVTERANIINSAEKAIIGTGKDLIDARNNKIDTDIRALGDWRYNEVLSLAKTVVEGDQGLLKLVKAIESDFNDPSFERVVNLVRKIYNVEVKKEDYYLPLSRTDFMGKEPGEDIKADLLNTVPGTKGSVEKGFTKERIKIAPRNQKSIRYDLFKVWTDSVKKQEHFVAMQEYVNQLNSIFEVSNTSNNVLREGIRNTYGESMLKDIDTHILEIADPNAGAVQSDPARDILKAAKGNIYSAYLGWKLSSITNQLITSPAAFFGKVGPIRYAKNLLQMTTSFKKTSEEVFNLSPFMKSRNFDLIAGEIKEAAEQVGLPKYKKVWNNFLEFGLKGLEWVDQYTVVAGWKAIYEQELEKLGSNTEENIRKAVQIADEYTQETQPQSNKTELAPLYKNKNEMLNILLQFQTSLNVVWNNLAYDTVHNFKRKDFRTALGTMAGYATAGALLSLAHGDFQPDDDDDDYNFWRTFLYSTVSQGVESIPVFSSYVDSIFGYVVNNEKPGYNTTSITPFPMLASAFDSGKYTIQAVKEKNTEALNKAIEKGADALMLGVGLPYSGVKELKAIQDRGVQALIGARE